MTCIVRNGSAGLRSSGHLAPGQAQAIAQLRVRRRGDARAYRFALPGMELEVTPPLGYRAEERPTALDAGAPLQGGLAR